MSELQIVSLLLITGAAALDDLYRGKISNGIIVTGFLWGMFCQIWMKGVAGMVFFWGGTLLPVILMAGIYYFRMIGAGDVKLLAVVGGFLGPAEGIKCLVLSIFLGGLFSLVILFRKHNFCQRLLCISEFVSECSNGRPRQSYLKKAGPDARFCFAVPVFLTVLLYVVRGGIS